MALPFHVLYIRVLPQPMGPQSSDSNSRPMLDDCWRYVSGFDNCSHQRLYWKHLRKYADNESVYRESLSSLTQAIFKTLTQHNMKAYGLWRYRPAPIPLLPKQVKALKVTMQLLPIVLALEKKLMKTTHITEGRMYATEGGNFLNR